MLGFGLLVGLGFGYSSATPPALKWFPASKTGLIAGLVGFNCSANLSLFPSFTKDLWELKSFGMNYGVLFTAWGVGGLVLPRLQQTMTTQSGSYQSSFLPAGVLLLCGAGLTFPIKPPQPRQCP